MSVYTEGTHEEKYTEGNTHGRVYTLKSLHIRGRLNTKESTYTEEYTRRRIHAGEEEYTSGSVHMEECTHGG